MEELIKLAAGNGIWAVLSIVLIKWILSTNEKREAKYQETILTLAEKFDIVTHIKEDVDVIKECLSCSDDSKTKRKKPGGV